MKIELETPFKEIYKCGYLVTNGENRKHVLLYNSQENRTTMSYARYLMSCNIGEIIQKEFEVDHIDNDKTNDILSNLQLLSKSDNIKKSTKQKIMIEFTCPVCKKLFLLEKRLSYKKENPCCCRRCGGIQSHITKSGNSHINN